VKQQALIAGAQVYLVKPVLPSEVVKTIELLLQPNREGVGKQASGISRALGA
jgi:DNA-binding response OmpR family regulator